MVTFKLNPGAEGGRGRREREGERRMEEKEKERKFFPEGGKREQKKKWQEVGESSE